MLFFIENSITSGSQNLNTSIANKDRKMLDEVEADLEIIAAVSKEYKRKAAIKAPEVPDLLRLLKAEGETSNLKRVIAHAKHKLFR